MYNLHCHSIISDGVLLPSELAMRHAAAGYNAIAITDHADYSNIENVVTAILKFTKHWPKNSNIRVFSGIELTHLPAEQFKTLSDYARKQGIQVIIGHGQTLVEPVIGGTNRAALEADIDILAHPGLISEEDAELAKQKGVFLEITSRNGHNRTNQHVIELAQKTGAKLILGLDAHIPEDIINPQGLIDIAIQAGLNQNQIDRINKQVEAFLSQKEQK